MVGDQVPFEMICPIAMDIKGFKEEILKLRYEARFVERYFEGIHDPSELIIYPAGSDGEGEPLPDDIPVPRDSSEYNVFSVFVMVEEEIEEVELEEEQEEDEDEDEAESDVYST